MSPRLTLVTGVGRAGQVGEAVAAAFAAAGDHVLLVSHGLDEVRARADDLARSGARVTPYACDLADAAQVDALAATIREEHGSSLDALVNLAGGFGMLGPVGDSTSADWERMMRINLTTAYQATRAFLPALRQARGAIVFFASEAALPGARVARMAAYAAAKAGVVTLMRAVAQEERDNGVRANAVAPAAIRTADNVRDMGADARYVEREDVASAVLFLCSPAARAVTGQVIRLG
ncbi:MAG TPA: SDR family oxidoreductase [Gemmatimonadaceae bacterium]|nr:SDR family oxidoreductase [Gemmatimonadaceae bacterium]